MNILVLGGTGTMGSELVKLLAGDRGNRVTSVSRHKGDVVEGVRYVIGNAFDIRFLRDLLKEHYDVIVDFMWHEAKTITAALPLILDSCGQYFFMSSAAVCAPSDVPINEASVRYIDVLPREETERSNDYHFLKARAEDVVCRATRRNWTVIRPHVTFGLCNLPLVLWGVEVWLKRMVSGMPVALPADVFDKKTTFTPGLHVARQIGRLIGKELSLGEIFQVGSETVHTWGDVVDVCVRLLMARGYDPQVQDVAPEAFCLKCPEFGSRLTYDRQLNRVFDLSKYKRVTGDENVDSEPMSVSIEKCLEKLMSGVNAPVRSEVMRQHLANDILCGYWVPWRHFAGRDKMLYALQRAGIGERTALSLVRPERALSQMPRFFRRLMGR